MRNQGKLLVVCSLVLGACAGKEKPANTDMPGEPADMAEMVASDDKGGTSEVAAPDLCVPWCGAKGQEFECGDDGCGGTCGSCWEDAACVELKDGTFCVERGIMACDLVECGVSYWGQCDDRGRCSDWRAWCPCADGEVCVAVDTGTVLSRDSEGDEQGTCLPASGLCGNGMCEADTVGEDCSSCPADCGCIVGFDCVGQQCLCVPACEGKECGDDGCGGTCGTCIAPCMFDADCPPGKECRGSYCNEPNNDCILDTDCAQGQYCHPGCVALKPTCQTEADCADADGKLCIAGFCGGPNEVLTCQDDAPCLAWMEGYACQDGMCKPKGACVLDSQCPAGQYCAGICLPIPELPECKTDAGCAPGQICENKKCKEPPDCCYDMQCPAGYVCEDWQCYNDEGVCAWVEKEPGFCDDGDPCTEDTCDAQTGCVHTPGACE